MNDEIKLKVKNVRKAYKDATPDGKKLIENLCGDEGKCFLSVSLLDRLKTVEDCFEETGRPQVDFSNVPEDMREHFENYYKALVVVEAHNEGERMDVYDSSTYRRYPYFEHGGSPSAFRFDVTHCDIADAFAGSGSRLSVKDDKAARAIGENFTDLFRDLLTK